MGGRWRYKRVVSLSSLQRLHQEDTQIMVGRWRYNIIVSLKYAKFSLQLIHKLW